MSFSSPTSLLDVDLQPRQAAAADAEATGDAPGWAAEHRDALRAVVAEHGSVLVRGLGLRDAARSVPSSAAGDRSDALRRRPSRPGRPTPRASTPRRSGRRTSRCACTTSSATRLEFPGLMLFACLGAPTAGGATAVADSPTVLDALPTELVERFERDGWLLTRSYNDEIGASVRRGVRHRGPWCRRELLPGQRDRVRVAARRRAAHQAAPQRRGPAPGHRPALLVQPDRLPQRVDHGPRGPRVPGGRVRRRRAAVQHPLRQRRPDRRGRRTAAQRGLRGEHRTRAVAGR